MRLKRFLLRYFPPGACRARRGGLRAVLPLTHLALALARLLTAPPVCGALVPAGISLEEERRDGSRNTRIIDLLQLSAE